MRNRIQEICQSARKAWANRLANKRGLSWYIERASIDESRLKEEYEASELKDQPETFCLVRIVGNDLYPRHKKGQTAENLRFILKNEPTLENCQKHWVINRVFDPDELDKITALLGSHNQSYESIPYHQNEYTAIERDYSVLPSPDFLESKRFSQLSKKQQTEAIAATYWKKNNYVMNNNGARNCALKFGSTKAKWVLPWDGNSFLTDSAWQALTKAVTQSPHHSHFLCPMARISDNSSLLNPNASPDANEEPQIIFRSDFKTMFNEKFYYGRRPKVELFWTLGIPGQWDSWEDAPWDPKRRELSDDAFGFSIAGWVARIASGMPMQEKRSWISAAYRATRRQEAIIETLRHLDQKSSKAS